MASSPLKVDNTPAMFMRIFTRTFDYTMILVCMYVFCGRPVLVLEAALHVSVTLHLEGHLSRRQGMDTRFRHLFLI